MDPKPIIGVIIVIVIVALSWWYLFRDTTIDSAPLVSNFAECAAAGYPVMESFPARCQTPDGRQFTQEITGASSVSDMIRIASVKAGDTITSPLVITGEARGMWFFEASFPITLEDANGNLLVTAVAQAGSDWMTEDFVPFTATLTFNRGTSTQGFLVFKKDNPSGLPEHDAELRLPVVLE